MAKIKKRNPTDATIRNVRAAAKRNRERVADIKLLTTQLKNLESLVTLMNERLIKLELQSK